MAGRPNAHAIALALAIAALGFAAPALAKDPIQIVVDHAKLVSVSRPADTIIIGNPGIADATVRDNRTVIITGKSYGTTNLIVLDAKGGEISNDLLTVIAGDEQMVTVYRRSDRQTYSCATTCQPVVTLGDDKTTFDDRKTQVTDRATISQPPPSN